MVKACNKYNEEVLKDFLMTKSPMTSEHLKEVMKVIYVVWAKHFAHYTLNGTHLSQEDKEDLEHYALLSLLAVRGESYKEFIPVLDENKQPVLDETGNPKVRKTLPSNFIYTKCRNEIGNKINKVFKREISLQEVNLLKRSTLPEISPDLPPEIQRYIPYLTGEEDYTILRISKQDALNLTLFLAIHTPPKIKLPPFIDDKDVNPVTVTMYKLLSEIFHE